LDNWRYRELYEVEDRHWWFRGRRMMIWAMLTRAGITSSPRILDAGCGTGRNLVEFNALGEAEGVDFSPEAVDFCRQRGLLGVQRAAIEHLPFEDGRFNLIFATDVIEHLDDDRLALTELRRVAAPDAHLVVTVPAYQWLWTAFDESLHHRRRYTLRELRERTIAAGWSPRVQTYFCSALLPAAIAVRTFRRFNGGNRRSSDLEPPGPVLNRLLEMPTHGEAMLVRRGRRLPAGLSVGLVCEAT
jgi:SAM-dependent methyltransferase